MKKGARGTDYMFPSEMLVMMNVIVDFKNQHRYDEDEFLDRIQQEMRSSLMERVSVADLSPTKNTVMLRIKSVLYSLPCFYSVKN